MAERMVVIGGNAAGMSAASEARRRRDAGDLRITVVEASSYVSYSACGEPYYVGGYIEDIDDLVVLTPEELGERDIDVRVRMRAVAIDAVERLVQVRGHGSDAATTLPYDVLVYAAGARASRPGIEGIELSGVHELRSLDDARALRGRVAGELGVPHAPRVERAVVVGGGYIGLETAEALVSLGIDTTVLTAGEAVLDPQLDVDMGSLVVDRMRRIGIDVRTGVRVKRIHGRDGHVRAVECGDEQFEADVVVLGLGSEPEVELAVKAGIALGETGAIAVDERQRTNLDGIYAAGDCAEALHRVSSRAANIHLGTVANKQGRVAGINIGGGEARFPGVLGTAITRLCDLEIARTGLTEAEARDAGFDVLALAFDSTTAAGYWPESSELRMKVTVDRGTRRLLGAQIVGGDGSGKRIDTFAVALWAGMTADELVHVDLSYAPPFSGVWDPVLVAARKALSQLPE